MSESLLQEYILELYLIGIFHLGRRLGVQVIQVCVETRSSNGGMISLKEVLAFVRAKKRANAESISAEDVKRAVEKIAILNSGFKIIEVVFWILLDDVLLGFILPLKLINYI